MEKLMKQLERLLEIGGTKKDIILLAVSGVSLILSLTNAVPLPFDIAWVAIILCGLPIILEAVIGLVTSFDIIADVLVSLALIASVCIGEDFAAGEVAFIMQLGALLEDLTVAKAREGIEKLVKLTPQTARVIYTDGSEAVVAAGEVKAGDLIRVLPGETVPVDGIIVSGQTSIDQSVMTGESLPVDKAAGDEVSSGTVNQFGAFEMKATKVGEDSSIQRMIRLVRSADAGEARIVGLADRWATWIVVIALTAAVATWAVTGQIIRAVTILVVFCPCALVLATPTAVVAAIGNASRRGLLVREGDALERLSKVSVVTFDKTGTLTHGTPEVTAVESVSDIPAEELFELAASAELLSEHPLGKSVVRCFTEKTRKTPMSPDSFDMIPGEGVTAGINGRLVRAGNLRLMSKAKIQISQQAAQGAEKYLDNGSTVIYIGVNDIFAGYIVLSDTVREESPRLISDLKTLGVRPVLLTGDHGNAASAIGKALEINDIHADCLPEDKLLHIEEYRRGGNSVCMIGDGINDAPALKKADVGIAMGGVGSDIAVDAADIALVRDEIKELPHLFALSGRMMTTIKANMIFSMALNLLAIILAMTGVLNPVAGALVHNAGSVLVIINSALLLRWRKK